MSWNTICIEGYCQGRESPDEVYPCGQRTPSHFCLLDGHCPHFAWSKTNEREVAIWVPMYLLLWDRLKHVACEVVWHKLSWWFWGQLPFNRRRMDTFFESIPIATRETCPSVAEREDQLNLASEEFIAWFERNKSELLDG